MNEHTRQTAMPATSDQTSVNVRFYRPGDEEGILRVLLASFPRWPEVETNVPPIDHLRWKLAGAAPPERNHLVAEADRAIIGVRLGLTQRHRMGSRTLIARLDVDSATLPDWRGRGIYTNMANFAVREALGADIVNASTGRPSLLELDQGLGHRPVKNRMVSMVYDPSDADKRNTRDFAVREAAAFDERTEDFWQVATKPYVFVAMPSVEWLNWRYCDHRGGIGTLLLAEEGRKLLGFAALRLSRGKGHIAYMLALPDRLDVVSGLTAAALTRLRNDGASEVDCALPKHHPYRSLMIEQGFTRKGHTIPLTCRPNRAGDVDLSFLQERKAALHLMLGDTDLV